VAGLKNNKEGETLIHTLVQLGKALSIETFAEGIEEHQELVLLQAEACDSGQGFLFARPLDPGAAESFFASWRDGSQAVSPSAATARDAAHTGPVRQRPRQPLRAPAPAASRPPAAPRG